MNEVGILVSTIAFVLAWIDFDENFEQLTKVGFFIRIIVMVFLLGSLGYFMRN